MTPVIQRLKVARSPWHEAHVGKCWREPFLVGLGDASVTGDDIDTGNFDQRTTQSKIQQEHRKNLTRISVVQKKTLLQQQKSCSHNKAICCYNAQFCRNEKVNFLNDKRFCSHNRTAI